MIRKRIRSKRRTPLLRWGLAAVFFAVLAIPAYSAQDYYWSQAQTLVPRNVRFPQAHALDGHIVVLYEEVVRGTLRTIDIGEPKNLHPRNKKDVGERLARLARAEVYRSRFPRTARRRNSSTRTNRS